MKHNNQDLYKMDTKNSFEHDLGQSVISAFTYLIFADTV